MVRKINVGSLRIGFDTICGLIALISFSQIIVGCNPEIKFPQVREFNPSWMSSAKELSSIQLVSSDEFVSARDFAVYNDSIIVVTNKPIKGKCFIELVRLDNKKSVGNYILYGNGPGEMLNVSSHLRNDSLYVHDFAKHQILTLNLGAAINSDSYRLPLPVTFCRNAGSPFVTQMDEDRIIMLNPYYCENQELGISNREDRFIVINEDEKPSLLYEHSRKYYSYNIEQGFIVPVHSKNRIVFCSAFYPVVEFYDFKLNPLVKVTGPIDLEPHFRIQDGEISFYKGVPYAYRGYALGNNCIYLAYIGSLLKRNERLQDKQSWIFKFDWNGNLLDTFHTDKYVGSLSVSSDERAFYARGFDEDGNIVLWKLIK